MSYYVTHVFREPRRVFILRIAIECLFCRGGARGGICGGADRLARIKARPKGTVADGL